MGFSSFNFAAAELLKQYALLLERQHANPFRTNAYLRAAHTLEGLDRDARTLVEQGGIDALTELPGVGPGLATAIVEIAKTGRLSRLDRLRGIADPEILLQTVPGIGPALARTIHESLDIGTLEALEIAAHDGRLERLPGVGPRRAAAIRASLASMLGRATGSRDLAPLPPPPVDLLLAVDREYRGAAAAGRLPTIAPRRFNPERAAWLPILHTDHGPWHCTALYSNTAKAHALHRTRDWVVVYFHGADHREGQQTIVTETRGPLRGRRVVRGRERECAEHYVARDTEEARFG